MIYRLNHLIPKLAADCFVAQSADLIGAVSMATASSAWFNVTIRADMDTIDIGAQSNIQDGAVLHVDEGCPMIIGSQVTVGHHAMLHGCSVGAGSLIGINAVVLNNARIGEGCLIGANTLITENMEIPDGSMVLGSPGKIVRTLDATTREALIKSATDYALKAKHYRTKLAPFNDASDSK